MISLCDINDAVFGAAVTKPGNQSTFYYVFTAFANSELGDFQASTAISSMHINWTLDVQVVPIWMLYRRQALILKK